MTAPPADVGFVFVHGIGTHKPGDTLLTHAEPLVSWVSDWNDAMGRDRISIERIDLDGDGAGPAHASVTIPLDFGQEARWLLAEAHWADSFPPPGSRAVVLWGARFAVRILRRVVGHLARPADLAYTKSLKAMGSVKETSIEANERNPATGYTSGASLVVATMYLVLGVLLFAAGIWIPVVAYVLALVLIGLVGVLGTWAVAAVLLVALKVPGLKAKVAPFALNLATSVGDTYTLLSRPLLAAAMRDRVVSSIVWVRERADHVVVVAHSQGAALSTRAILHDSRLRDVQVDALVTLGGAVALLQDGTSAPVNDWQQLRPDMRWLNIWTAWDPVSAGPVVDSPKDAGERWRELYSPDPNAEPEPDLSEVLPWLRAQPADPEPAAGEPTASLPAQLAKGASAGVGAAYTGMANVMLSVIPSVELPEPRAVPGPTEIATHNRASLAGDHSSYMTNGPQVVRRIADLAADLGGYNEDWLNDDMTAWATKAERWHVTAVRVLGATRLVSFMLAAVVTWTISGSLLPADLFVRGHRSSDRHGERRRRLARASAGQGPSNRRRLHRNRRSDLLDHVWTVSRHVVVVAIFRPTRAKWWLTSRGDSLGDVAGALHRRSRRVGVEHRRVVRRRRRMAVRRMRNRGWRGRAALGVRRFPTPADRGQGPPAGT